MWLHNSFSDSSGSSTRHHLIAAYDSAVPSQAFAVDVETTFAPVPRRLALGNRYVYAVEHEDRRFLFRRPINVSVDFAENTWTYECQELGILSFHESRLEARAIFGSDFAAFWDLIANEEDHNLAADARRLKRKLLELVQVVTAP